MTIQFTRKRFCCLSLKHWRMEFVSKWNTWHYSSPDPFKTQFCHQECVFYQHKWCLRHWGSLAPKELCFLSVTSCFWCFVCLSLSLHPFPFQCLQNALKWKTIKVAKTECKADSHAEMPNVLSSESSSWIFTARTMATAVKRHLHPCHLPFPLDGSQLHCGSCHISNFQIPV